MTFQPRSLFIAAFLLMVVSVTVCFSSGDSGFASARELIVMRSIGHEILRSSGDSTSRVLPVYKTSDNQYHVSFGSTFTFSPDSVIAIVRQAIEQNHLPADYIVNVVECQTKQIIFGFAILKTEKTNLVPCKGRKQPKACYAVNITFRHTMLSTPDRNYMVGAGGGLTALVMLFSGLKMSFRRKRAANHFEEAPQNAAKIITIGRYKFYTDGQYLEYEDKKIDLSDKEAKLLKIFAKKQNEIVERTDLQRVWKDEGVIVGRSLDVFISKLRKKLESDSTIRVVNIHGKGYKLETT